MKTCALGMRLSLFIGLFVAIASVQISDKKPDHKTISISLAEVQKMLSRKLTVQEVEKKFGTSSWKTTQNNWNIIIYAMPNGRRLAFSAMGPYIVRAIWHDTDIEGIRPKSSKMRISLSKIWLDSQTFRDLYSFKEYLRKLPRGSIIEWQHSDIDQTEWELFLKSKEELKSFEDYCEEIGIILIQYMAG
jgi:hypothetical protein